VATQNLSSVNPQSPPTSRGLTRTKHAYAAAQPTPFVSPQSLLRLPEVLRLIPVKRSTWWQGVRLGKFPAPVRLGPRVTAWKAIDILRLTGWSNPDE
jgi:predicted DNA-binding transcriptional regulator AlpA